MALEQLTKTTPSSHTSFDYDAAIVGGGIVGATLACALKDSGLSVVLIEAQPQSAQVKAQAYNLSLLSGRIFRESEFGRKYCLKLRLINKFASRMPIMGGSSNSTPAI
jgi:choline dehydrogenase-like flavoprotein